MTKRKAKLAEPVVVDTEPLKRFLNKQQNLKIVREINLLDEFQTRLERTRQGQNIEVTFGLTDKDDYFSTDAYELPIHVAQKIRDQATLVIIDEIDALFLTLKENL